MVFPIKNNMKKRSFEYSSYKLHVMGVLHYIKWMMEGNCHWLLIRRLLKRGGETTSPENNSETLVEPKTT